MKSTPKPGPGKPKSPLNIVFVGLQAGLALALVSWVVSFIVGLFSPAANDLPISFNLIVDLSFLIWLPLLFILLGRHSNRRRPIRTMFSGLDLSAPTWKHIGWGLVITLATLQLLGLLSIALDWLGLIDSAQEQALLELIPTGGWGLFWFFILVALLTPIVEEIIFRRGLYKLLSGRIGFGLALTISSLLFGLVHFDGSGLGAVVATTIAGAVLVLVYRWSDNLWVPIIMHMTVNTLTIVAQVLGYGYLGWSN